MGVPLARQRLLGQGGWPVLHAKPARGRQLLTPASTDYLLGVAIAAGTGLARYPMGACAVAGTDRPLDPDRDAIGLLRRRHTYYFAPLA